MVSVRVSRSTATWVLRHPTTDLYGYQGREKLVERSGLVSQGRSSRAKGKVGSIAFSHFPTE